MKKVTIYHNNRCSKSRQALCFLDECIADIEVVQYINHPMSKATLKSILKKLGYTADQLLRKNEQVYKELVKGKSLTEDALIDLMLLNPKLIERPIVVFDNTAFVARPPELVKDFFR